MTTAVSTTGTFQGADVDGLDKLASEFTQAANVCNEVKMACEVIVAVASFFGPFGAGFVAYLKGTVIPWLTKIGEALTLMAKVLSVHSQAQKDTSSTATSLPSYTSPTNLPTTDTTNFPDLSSLVPTTTTTPGATTATPPSSTVSTPPAIGGSTPTGTAAGGSGGSDSSGGLGALGGALSGGTGNDTLGTLSVPVRISPDGTISGLYQTPSATDPITTPITTPIATPVPVPVTSPVPATTPTLAQPLDPGSRTFTSDPLTMPDLSTVTPTHDLTAGSLGGMSALGGGTGGGTGGGSGGGMTGGSGGGFTDAGSGGSFTPAVAATAPTLGAQTQLTAAHTPITPDLRGGAGGSSHDGLFTGLGTATGLGAGGAALARAVLSEARQRGDGSMLGAAPLPFDADADPSAQATVFDGALG